MFSLPHVASGLPRAFWILFFGTLINRLGGFVLIFLAIYLTEVRGLSVAHAGAIISCYGFGAIVAALCGGILADRLGRRPTLVCALTLGATFMLLLGFARTLPEIALAALLTGLLYELYRPAVSAAVADMVSPEDRPRAFSLIYWAVNVGASVAPVMGGFLAAYSYKTLFIADAATTFLYGLIVWKALPETRPATPQNSAPTGMRTVLKDGRFVLVCLFITALSVVFFQSFTILPLDLRAHGISPAGFGGIVAINGVLIVLFQPFVGTFLHGRSWFRVLALASVLIGVGFGLNALATTVPWYVCATVIWTIGEIIYSPAGPALAAKFAPVELRGRYQGLLSMAFGFGFFLAPLIGGWTAGALGFQTVWMACLAIGLGTALGFLLLDRVRP